MQYLPLFERIDSLAQLKSHVIIAIDGNSAAGKSTLAALLAAHYNCNVFHIDDFFLQPNRRTTSRLAETGGNIDYERFALEVLNMLRMNVPFAYYPYNCKTQTLDAVVNVIPKPINIIEGAYSLHPYFGDYDIKVFLTLNAEQQRSRLMQRNPHMYKRFISEWVPMENKYFEEFKIMEKCDFVFMPDKE